MRFEESLNYLVDIFLKNYKFPIEVWVEGTNIGNENDVVVIGVNEIPPSLDLSGSELPPSFEVNDASVEHQIEIEVEGAYANRDNGGSESDIEYVPPVLDIDQSDSDTSLVNESDNDDEECVMAMNNRKAFRTVLMDIGQYLGLDEQIIIFLLQVELLLIK